MGLKCVLIMQQRHDEELLHYEGLRVIDGTGRVLDTTARCGSRSK